MPILFLQKEGNLCHRVRWIVFALFSQKKDSPAIWNDAVLKGRKPLYKLYISIITNKFTVMNSSFPYRACRLYQHKRQGHVYKNHSG